MNFGSLLLNISQVMLTCLLITYMKEFLPEGAWEKRYDQIGVFLGCSEYKNTYKYTRKQPRTSQKCVTL